MRARSEIRFAAVLGFQKVAASNPSNLMSALKVRMPRKGTSKFLDLPARQRGIVLNYGAILTFGWHMARIPGASGQRVQRMKFLIGKVPLDPAMHTIAIATKNLRANFDSILLDMERTLCIFPPRGQKPAISIICCFIVQGLEPDKRDPGDFASKFR